MTPYYTEPGVTIYCGDCIELIPLIEASLSVVIADPPYGETSLEWDRRNKDWPRVAYLFAADSASLWCFGSFRMFYECGGLTPWKFGQDVIWEKNKGSSFHADRFKRVHEHAVHFYKGDWSGLYKKPVHTYDALKANVRRSSHPASHVGAIGAYSYKTEVGGPRLMRSVIYVSNCHGYAVHPTQKPVKIIAPLVEYSAAPGALVLDPFMGSGSVMVACKRAGVNYIGIEIDEKFCALAVERLRQGVLDLAEVSA